VGFSARRKRHEAEVRAHTITNGAIGRLSRQDRQPSRRVDADLAGKMDDGLVRDAFGVIGEATGPAQAAHVQRGPQTTLAAGAMDLPKISFGKQPIAEQHVEISLVLRCVQHVIRRD